MRIASSILIALVLMAIASVSGRFHRHHRGCWHSKPKGRMQPAPKNYRGCETFKSKDQIQIYRPKGLRVTQNSANLFAFGINVYVVKKKGKNRSYWLQTMEVDPNSNNFTLYAPTAEIRDGDIFYYTIIKQYNRRMWYDWYNCGSFRVSGSLIKDAPVDQTGSYDPDAQDGKNNESQTTPSNSATLNENSPITNTFVLTLNTDVTTESALREFIFNQLTALVPSVDWNNTLSEVFRWNSKFSFDVKTAEQKRNILRLLEKNKDAAEVILDFDNMETSDNSEDYDYDEE